MYVTLGSSSTNSVASPPCSRHTRSTSRCAWSAVSKLAGAQRSRRRTDPRVQSPRQARRHSSLGLLLCWSWRSATSTGSPSPLAEISSSFALLRMTSAAPTRPRLRRFRSRHPRRAAERSSDAKVLARLTSLLAALHGLLVTD